MNTSENVRYTRKKYVLQIYEILKDFVLSEFAHRAYQVTYIFNYINKFPFAKAFKNWFVADQHK